MTDETDRILHIRRLTQQANQAADFYSYFPTYVKFRDQFTAVQEGQNPVPLSFKEYNSWRNEYQKGFRSFITYLIIELGYTQLIHGQISTLEEFNNQLVFYGPDYKPGESPLPMTLDLYDIERIVREDPEANLEKLAKFESACKKVAATVHKITEATRTRELSPSGQSYPEFWSLNPDNWTWNQGQDNPTFLLNPIDDHRYNFGFFTAEEIEQWANFQTGPIAKEPDAR